jgi:hypothetical protein
MSLDEIGEWIKLNFDLTVPELEDIGGVCSHNAALAFKDFALEFKNNC